MKKLALFVLATACTIAAFAQDSTGTKKSSRDERREERRRKVNDLIRQEEEGVLVYKRQSIFGVQLRTSGYGVFYETGRMKSQRNTSIYSISFTEIKHRKEDKSNAGFLFGNPYVYGKINNFYQLQLGFGQQRILGQKGNKNGVALSLVYSGGLSLGMLRPYYVDVDDNGVNRTIKYTPEDSILFVDGPIYGASGISKGWNELKIKPGAFAKSALRFDYGRFNEVVSGLEVGLSVEFYSDEIPILLFQDHKQLFFQGHIAILFGRRK